MRNLEIYQCLNIAEISVVIRARGAHMSSGNKMAEPRLEVQELFRLIGGGEVNL